jgi:hypothetical protein
VNINPGARAVLVPPRPNLGPEPLGRSIWGDEAILAGLLVTTVAASGLVAFLRYRRRRLRARPEAAGSVPPRGPFATRREQMAAWSTLVRTALAARFGGGWHARTTEEIAAEAALVETLGAERAGELVRFLVQADLAKFDDRDGLQPPLPDLEAAPEWLAALLASASPAPAPVPSAGASSRIKGK